MVTVALAGATTGLGQVVLNRFLAQNKAAKHTLVLLSRTPQPHLTALGVHVRIVDYTDHATLVASLSGVHTLLSFIGGAASTLQTSQLAIISAAKEAGVVRFAPSDYAGVGYKGIDLYAGKAVVWEAVKQSGLEYTRFSCGLFMDILATGTPKVVVSEDGENEGEREALGGLRPWNFVVNVKAGTAELPGNGNAKVVFTTTKDVARFVAATVDLQSRWPEELGMRGDLKSFKEVVRIVEEVQERKFLVREDSVEEMREKGDFYNQVRLKLAEGWGVVGREMNELAPQVQTTSVRDFVEKWWGGVELEESAWVENVHFGAEDMAR